MRKFPECTLSTLAALVLAAGLPMLAIAADAPVAELEQRLSTEGVDQVNAYLAAHGPGAMVPLHDSAAACDLQAVSLTLRLARGSHVKVVAAHTQSLRLALGICPDFVLAMLSPTEVPRFCASVPSWTLMQTARELRRRMRVIDADPALSATTSGRACRAAYLYELQNTRVGLRAATPR